MNRCCQVPLFTVMFFVVILFGSSLMTSTVMGQAFCSLRDPVRQIQSIYPKASFETSVEIVDSEARAAVAKSLPLELHFNELGQHTLYNVLINRSTVGLVHVRPERYRYGIMEVLWAFDSDLRIHDFRMQRCRSANDSLFERKGFRDQIVGKGFEGIRDLLVDDCSRLKPGKLKVGENEQALAAAVLRCALKTLVVTRVVWKKRVERLRLVSMARQARKFFPRGKSLRSAVVPYTNEVLVELTRERVKTELDIRRDSVAILQVMDADGAVAGNIVSTDWEKLPVDRVLYWVVALDGTIVDVTVGSGWPNDEIAGLFAEMKGKDRTALKDCKTAAELAATEVLVLLAEIR